MEQDFKMNVLGRVMEQYRHPVGYFESGAYRSFSRTKAFIWDWGVRWLRARQGKSAAATNIPGYTDAAFLEEVARIYLEVQGAQAVMQADLARDVSGSFGGSSSCLSESWVWSCQVTMAKLAQLERVHGHCMTNMCFRAVILCCVVQ